MQNLNRDAMSGIPRRYDARDFKLMRSVAHFEPVLAKPDLSPIEVILALRELGLPKMSAGRGRLDIE
jgi:hypothetical protein